MKTIHVLPTDKPSRLWVNNLLQGKLELSKEALPYNTAQNIYITSDAEITEGDYYIKLQNRQYVNRSGKTKFKGLYKDCKKIILTTDQDLIKDGVQVIDDEFLEWFVKNPSCEEVEIKSWIKTYEDGSTFDRMDYEIIIPKEEAKPFKQMEKITEVDWQKFKKNPIPSKKEEPKQEIQGYICPQTKKQCDDECCISAEDCHIEASFGIISDCEPPKQETLEEFIKRQLSLGKYQDQESAIKYSILSGAKWQQERSYSEEEVLDILFSMSVDNPSNITKWFEHFKKK